MYDVSAKSVSSGPQLNEKRIMVFAGPSGGHLYPALAFTEAFQAKYPDSHISLVTTDRAKPLIVKSFPENFQKYHFLPEFPLPSGNLLKRFVFLLKLVQAFFLSASLLIREKPNACVGFGSFVSFPGMWLASKFKIPTIIHEQNLRLGKATQWLASTVDCVALSFDNTMTELKDQRGVCVGLPLRRSLHDSAEKKRQQATHENRNGKRALLIFGGSQGASVINHVVVETLTALPPEEMAKLAVIHITGTADFEWVKEAYRSVNLDVQVHPFFDRMQDLYGKADMAITRAGANTLFELALFNLPAVVIPYPHAGSHQSENIQYFEKKVSLSSCPQDEFNSAWLTPKVISFLRSTSGSKQTGQFQVAENAASKLVELVEKSAYQEIL